MPRSKDPGNYPAEYLEAVKKAVLNTEEVRVHFSTNEEARKVYNNYYSGFVASMNRIRVKLENLRREPTAEEAGWLDNLALCRRAMVSVERTVGGGADVVFRSKRMSPFAVAFRSATVKQEEAGPLPSWTEEAQMLERLKGLATPGESSGVSTPPSPGSSPGPIIPEMEKTDEVKEKTSKYGRREDK